MSALLRALALSLFSTSLFAQVSLTTNGTAVTQNFDTLASTSTSTLTPTGWTFAESGTNANATYTANNGGANGGDTYSYGATGLTERAFGGLQSSSLVPTVGASFINNTGGAISALDISYTGEQWRLGTTARLVPDQLDFQYSLDATSLTTGTWIDVNALDFLTPNPTAAAGVLDGNLAANRTLRSAAIPALAIAGGATFWIRWNSFDAIGADDGLSIDDFSITPQGAGNATSIRINDVTVTEGNAGGTVTASFTVSLSAATGTAVTFDIATQDSTATVANGDYVARALIAQSIAAGQQTYSFAVTVNGDTAVEPNEAFFVNLSNVSAGVVVADGQGVGTITNDDVVVTPISTVQGSGAASTLAGSTVTIEGIVTARKSNGFFVQTADAQIDPNPATSEGMFVFTTPPATAALGNRVQVTGTVTEFIPTAAPNQPPTTELTGTITVTQLSTGNALPAPIAITTINPAGAFDQLERFEHMRVSFAGNTVTAGTGGFVSEPNATGTSNGVFWMTLNGAPRPQREPGIDVRFPLPAGAPAGVPRFDANPESLRVDSDSQVGALALNLVAGQTIGPWVGVLDYGFLAYTFIPDPGQTPVISAVPIANSVPATLVDEFSVAGYNLQRLFDTDNDPVVSDPIVTPDAFRARLSKASRQIRQNLGSPDVVSVIEVENESTLQALAMQISMDGGPTYTVRLIEGNDVGGIDVGFMVKTSPVTGATPRVSGVTITQEGATATYLNPATGIQDLLNDRPPLLLRATINSSTGGSANVTVLVNHLRSFVGADDPVDGPRIRAKRRAQAEFVANLVQARQVADPNERIVVLGDFNAYEFNDGFVDSIGTILGSPAPATLVILPSADLVNPNLLLLQDAVPVNRYSYVFDGNTQSIDHLMVSQGLVNTTLARRLEHIRFNADYPEVARSNFTSNTRLSDHDALVGFFRVASLGTPTASIAVAPATINELAAPTASTITVTLSFAPSIATTVNLGYSGTAVRGSDYNAPLTIVVPANANSFTAQLSALDDALVEPAETAIVTVAAGTGYSVGVPTSGTVTIQSKDVIPVASFTVNPLSINELGAPTSSVVTVTLTPAPTQAGTLSFAFAGTATRTTDYLTTGLTGDNLSFAAGETSKTFTISAVDDALVELTETVAISFGSLNGATAGTPNTASLSIVSEDLLVASVSLSPSVINELDTPRVSTLTVNLGGPALVNTTVNLSYAGTAVRGVDFDAPLSVLIPAGASSASAQLTVIDDAAFEATETVQISIAAGTGYIAGAGVPASLSIVSNDLIVSQIPTLDHLGLLAMLGLMLGFGLVSLRKQTG